MTLSAPGTPPSAWPRAWRPSPTTTRPRRSASTTPSVVEGNAGSQNAVFTVSLSAASGLGASATFVTANATATAGSDYTAVSDDGDDSGRPTSVTVNVPVLGDTLAEADRDLRGGVVGAGGGHGRRPRRRRHDHRQRPAGAEHRGRDDCRGQQRLVGRHLHRLAVPERGGSGDRDLRHRERHGRGRQRLHGRSGHHADVPARNDQPAGERERHRRYGHRAQRDLRGQPHPAGRGDNRRRPGGRVPSPTTRPRRCPSP